MTVGRGLFRLWIVISIVWILALLTFVAWLNVPLTSFGVLGVVALGIAGPVLLLTLGYVALWIVSGFIENSPLKPSPYFAAVMRLGLLLFVIVGAFTFWSDGPKEGWPLSPSALLARTLGAGVSGEVLGLLIGMFAYRKLRRVP